jgi:hypothetical protein
LSTPKLKNFFSGAIGQWSLVFSEKNYLLPITYYPIPIT